MIDLQLLPGVPEDYVIGRLNLAPGNELSRGKLTSPDSSSALAVNALGWFHQRPADLPPIPGTESAIWPALEVEVEYKARFPWTGGEHPWLDAVVKTKTTLIGVESKRHEPCRDRHKVEFTPAYDRPVLGDEMGSFTRMRDSLRDGSITYQHLDVTQLVKHAFGLVTESRRCRIAPLLVYLYAEPDRWSTSFADHRREVDHFTNAVSGAAVQFVQAPWSDWLKSWQLGQAAGVAEHGARLMSRFHV